VVPKNFATFAEISRRKRGECDTSGRRILCGR
jgi:hypothetical protein